MMNDDTKLKIETFTDLNVWKEGHKLVLFIYQETKSFPKDETYGLISQMRRAAVSITSNVAEGFGRQSYAEKVQFYSISKGSLAELQNQLIVSKDLKYMNEISFQKGLDQSTIVNKLLTGIIKKSRTIHHSSFNIRHS